MSFLSSFWYHCYFRMNYNGYQTESYLGKIHNFKNQLNYQLIWECSRINSFLYNSAYVYMVGCHLFFFFCSNSLRNSMGILFFVVNIHIALLIFYFFFSVIRNLFIFYTDILRISHKGFLSKIHVKEKENRNSIPDLLSSAFEILSTLNLQVGLCMQWELILLQYRNWNLTWLLNFRSSRLTFLIDVHFVSWISLESMWCRVLGSIETNFTLWSRSVNFPKWCEEIVGLIVFSMR